jgi:CBS domain-containing protein
MDWFAGGLPMKGTRAGIPRAADHARRDVPTCRLDERVGEVQQRVRAAGWNVCVVVNEECVVLGLLETEALETGPEATAEQAMTPGPSTFRPNVTIEEMAGYLREHGMDRALITTLDGKLVGLLSRADAEAAAGA